MLLCPLYIYLGDSIFYLGGQYILNIEYLTSGYFIDHKIDSTYALTSKYLKVSILGFQLSLITTFPTVIVLVTSIAFVTITTPVTSCIHHSDSVVTMQCL